VSTIDDKLESKIAEFKRLREQEPLLLARIRELEEALDPFVRHGRAAGAFDDEGQVRFYTEVRFYTDTGYRLVPAEDFRRAAAALSTKGGAS